MRTKGLILSPVIGRASSKQIAFARRLRLFRSHRCLRPMRRRNHDSRLRGNPKNEFASFRRFNSRKLAISKTLNPSKSTPPSRASVVFHGTTNERPKGSHYCNIGSRACAISQPMISAFWLVEPPRPERPWWPVSISVRSNKSRGSVLLARSRATHLAGSA